MENQSDPLKAAIESAVDKATTELIGMADSVRIFVNHSDSDFTFVYTSGKGNFSAQYGQIREWLLCQEELMKESVRNKSDDE